MSSRDVAHSNIWADLSAQIFEHFPVVYATELQYLLQSYPIPIEPKDHSWTIPRNSVNGLMLIFGFYG